MKKSDGTLRLCRDSRALNAVTQSDPLPIITHLVDLMTGARFFSSLGARSAFWHIPMRPEHREKTASMKQEGKYEWLCMPFWLQNAHSTIQRLMDEVLESFPFA